MPSNTRVSQPALILGYLKQRKTINSIEAFGLFGITRLAAVVHRLRQRGYKIVSVDREGIRGRYTEYLLSV